MKTSLARKQKEFEVKLYAMIVGLNRMDIARNDGNYRTSCEQIAKLTEADLQLLSDHELQAIVRSVKIPFIDESQIETQQRPTLIKLAILARNACSGARN